MYEGDLAGDKYPFDKNDAMKMQAKNSEEC